MSGWLYALSPSNSATSLQPAESVRVIHSTECASRQFLIDSTIGFAGLWLSVLGVTDYLGDAVRKFPAARNIPATRVDVVLSVGWGTQRRREMRAKTLC